MTPTQQIELLRAACCVAGIDKEASDAEMSVIAKLVKKTGVGKASLQAMMDRSISDEEFYKEQFHVLKADPSESMAFLLQVAMADGKLTEGEIHILEKLSQRLDVSTEDFQRLITQVNEMLSS